MFYKLIQDQVDFFNENGYLLTPNIFTENECDVFQSYVRRHANQDFAAIVDLDRYEELLRQDEREKTEQLCKEVQETVAYARNILKRCPYSIDYRTAVEQRNCGFKYTIPV